jgi:phosphatidate phosphatase APP1
MSDEVVTITSPLMNNGAKIGTVEVTDDKQGNVTSKVQFEIPITQGETNIGMIKVTTNSNGEVVPNVVLKCPVSQGEKSVTVEITIDEKGSASAKCNLPTLPIGKIGKLF